MTCSRRPANHTQLDNGEPTRAFDCGVEKTRDALDFASCGKVQVSVPKLRELMGKPGKQPTNPRDWKTAIESDFVAAKFRAKGLRPPRARLLDGVTNGEAEKDLHAGRFLVAALWYGTVNALAPRKSASRTFGDNHALGVYALPVGDVVRPDTLVQWSDPLADGRRDPAGGRYPKGTQRIKWDVVRRACGNLRVRTRNAAGQIISERRLGTGLFLGISIARSKPLAGPAPEPEPEPVPEPFDCTEELVALRAEIESALGEIDAGQDAIVMGTQRLEDAVERIDELLEETEGS